MNKFIEHYYIDCLVLLGVQVGAWISDVENILSFATVCLAFLIGVIRLRKELRNRKVNDGSSEGQ